MSEFETITGQQAAETLGEESVIRGTATVAGNVTYLRVRRGWLRISAAGGTEWHVPHGDVYYVVLHKVLKPRVFKVGDILSSAEEFDGLPVGAVVIDSGGDPWQKARTTRWAWRHLVRTAHTLAELTPPGGQLVHLPGGEA